MNRLSRPVLLLPLLLTPVTAQQITGVTGSESAGSVAFTVSAPDSYGSARLIWVEINGVLIQNIPAGGIELPGTNGTTAMPVPGIEEGDAIEVAVTFDLADGSGGFSTTASGDCGQ